MTRKWRLITWGIYSMVSFLILLIGFELSVSISASVIIGFICGMLNEIINLLRNAKI